MAAGAVSLRKSHDVVILSFCNIVKGQADCQHFWPAKNPNACSRWNSPGFLYILQIEDMLENKRAFDDPPKRFQSNISSSASLSVLSIHAWLVGSAPGCQNNLMDSQSSARQKVGKTTLNWVETDLTKWCLHHQIGLVQLSYITRSIPGKRPERPFKKELKKCCPIMQVLFFHIRLHPHWCS